ncbi:Dicer-like protein 1, partial [Spiromyces aspiralis]
SFGADPNTVNMLFSPCKRDPAKREEAHIDLNAAFLLIKGDVNLQDVPPESWHMYKGRVAWDHLQRGRVIFITDILYGTDPTATFEELLELSQVPSAVDDNGGPGCRGEASPDELSGWIERAVGSTRDISEFKHAQGKRHFREASTIAGLLANAPYHVPVKEFKMFLHAPLYRTAKYSPQLDYTAFNPAYLEYSVLHGQPLPKLQKKPTSRSGFASPLLCTVKQFDLVHLGNLSMIPSFIFRCHSMLLVHEFKQEFSVPADVELLRTALTASGAQADTNYERLEALGDSVLKFVVTAILFALHPDADEGQLTDARVKIVSNRHLARVARQNRLDRYIWAHKFLPKQWLPPTNAWWHINPQYEKGRQYSEQTMQNVSNKMYADLVESILGACYLSSGVQGALAFIRRIKLMNEPQISDWQSIDDVWRAGLGRALGGPAPRVELEPDMVSGIERIFGYKFEDQCILGAACRHPSFTEAAKAPPGGDNNERHPLKALQDYQSLEFLGDSVIDLFVLEHYYNFVPALDPGQITLVKHISVSND